MYVCFDQEGVLNIKPETHSDVMTLKWFLKEFATHGVKMINIETEIDQSREQDRGQHYRQYYPVEDYGYGAKRNNSWYEGNSPFNPQAQYSGRQEDDYEAVYPKDREDVSRYYADAERRTRGNPGNRR